MPQSFPFAHVESTLRKLSFQKVPDPEVNILFEVDDTSPPESKFLLEFVEDGIRVYKQDGTTWKFIETVLLERVKSCTIPPGGNPQTVNFEWNRGKDGSMHKDTFKTKEGKLIADTLFKGVQEKLSLRKVGEELKILNIWSGGRVTPQ